jgi:hypothetical protein
MVEKDTNLVLLFVYLFLRPIRAASIRQNSFLSFSWDGTVQPNETSDECAQLLTNNYRLFCLAQLYTLIKN